ncbi:MAG: hypothetical protein IT223_11655 [Crocinitomicaceae bacterium]|nr:hypothetical protein [Crocinitomicaceae bacterium]
MKNLTVNFIFVFLSLGVTAGNIILEGRYQQRSIYVINTVSPDGAGFCVYEVTVNGLVSSDEVNSQAFEIDLSIYNLKVGDPVSIIIKHKDGCLPKILNPAALEPAPTFNCTKIECTDQGQLSWETRDELGKLPFIIQQFKWNKWVNIGEVMGNGNVAKNTYKFQATLTSGHNKLRVVQKSYEGDLRKSQTAEVTSTVTAVTFKYDRKTKKINFSADTSYELYNVYGQIVKRGYGNNVDVTSLHKGDYYLSYDNKTDKFLKK